MLLHCQRMPIQPPSKIKTSKLSTLNLKESKRSETVRLNGSWRFTPAYPSNWSQIEEDTYLLRPAVDILKSHAVLTAEQIAYLDAYAIDIEIESQPIEYSPPNDEPQSSEEAEGEYAERKQDEMIVVGQTTFSDLLDWGVPVDQIEAIIGGEIPNRLMLVRDYCTENGLSFGGIKIGLQAEIDKIE